MSETGMSDAARSRGQEIQATRRARDMAARHEAEERERVAAEHFQRDSVAGAEYDRADDWAYDDSASGYLSPRH